MRHPTKILRALPVLLLALVLAGCSSIRGGAYDLPLPGGPDVGDNPMTIKAQFDDVLDLVPHSSVKLDDVDVGQVTDIELVDEGRAALVTLRIRGDLDLTGDASARLEQTSLLGEKYVALTAGDGDTPLADGAELGLATTSQAVNAEEVLGALSMLLTGGGVAQFQSIAKELEAVGGGRTPEIREFLEDVDTFVAALNKKRPSISVAIDRMGDLSKTLSDNRDRIEDVLTRLTPGLEEISDQREDLVRMLDSLDGLSDITVQILNASSKDMVTTFRQLRPVLRQLARSGADLPRSWELLPTFPFTDAILEAIKGDYINAFITMSIMQTTTAQPPGKWPYAGRSSRPPLMLTSPDDRAKSDAGDSTDSADDSDAKPTSKPSAGTDPTDGPSGSSSPNVSPTAEGSPSAGSTSTTEANQ